MTSAPFTAPVVRPDPDSRLDQLTAEYATLKPKVDDLTARLKTVTDGIKAELTSMHPKETEILLVGSILAAPLQLEAVTSWRIDTPKLKSEQPQLYVRYAKQSTSWRLCQVKQS